MRRKNGQRAEQQREREGDGEFAEMAGHKRGPLFPRRVAVTIRTMEAITIAATIRNGQIIPDHPEKLPASGRAVVTLIVESESKPDWEKIRALLGSVKFPLSGLEYERMIRSEWDERDARESLNRL